MISMFSCPACAALRRRPGAPHWPKNIEDQWNPVSQGVVLGIAFCGADPPYPPRIGGFAASKADLADLVDLGDLHLQNRIMCCRSASDLADLQRADPPYQRRIWRICSGGFGWRVLQIRISASDLQVRFADPRRICGFARCRSAISEADLADLYGRNLQIRHIRGGFGGSATGSFADPHIRYIKP